MSTRVNGVICWYCDSDADEPCEACDEVNAILAVLPDGVSIERLVAVFNRVFEFGPTAQHTHGGEYGDGWRACIDHLRGVR